MEVFEGIRTLLAVRRYQDKSVPEAIVRKIVEAGRLTGRAMNLQPWHFVVVTDPQVRAAVADVFRRGFVCRGIIFTNQGALGRRCSCQRPSRIVVDHLSINVFAREMN